MEDGRWQAEDIAARVSLPTRGWLGEILFILLMDSLAPAHSALRAFAFGKFLSLLSKQIKSVRTLRLCVSVVEPSLFPEFLSSDLSWEDMRQEIGVSIWEFGVGGWRLRFEAGLG